MSDITGMQKELYENIAAISADLHTHRKFPKFYERIGPDVGGCMGIYALCGRIGEALTHWEADNGRTECYDKLGLNYIEFLEAIVAKIFTYSFELQEKGESWMEPNWKEFFTDLMVQEFHV